jgi:CoA:oxalate CoA-transferase
MKQAVEDPQIAARNMIVRAGPMRMPGNPIKFRGRDDSGERSPAPALDANGAAIRREFAPEKGPT